MTIGGCDAASGQNSGGSESSNGAASSSESSFNPLYPDGFEGEVVHELIFGGYTVPAGKTLNILWAADTAGGALDLQIDGSIYLSQSLGSMVGPMLVPAGSNLSTSDSDMLVTGFLAAEGVQTVQLNLNGAYNVPVGNTFVMMTVREATGST